MAFAQALSRRSVHWPVFANAATVGVLTSVAKLAGAAKIVVMARFFGASDELDAFLTAFVLPSLFADVVAGSFTPCLVPALIRARSDEGAGAAARLAQSALGLAVGAMLAVAAALAIGGRAVLPLLGASFSNAKLHLTWVLFLALLLWLPMGALIATWRAVLNANERFALAAAVPLATPVMTIALLYAGAMRWGVHVLWAATVCGVAIECLVLAAAVRGLGYPALPVWGGCLRHTRLLRREYLPLMAGTAVFAASALVDQAFAGTLGSGAVSSLAYGTRLAAVLLAISAAAIATAVLPEFSRLAARNEWARLRRAVLVHAGAASLLMIPATALLIWFSGPLVRFFFERGAFDPASTRLVAVVQQCALVQAPFAILFAIASRLATALSANALLAKVGLAALAVNAISDWALARAYGIAGIALSTSLVQASALVVLAVLLHRREPRLFGGR